MYTLAPVITAADSGERLVVGPTHATILVSADHAAGHSLILLEFATEFTVPTHRHDRTDHVWHVIAGTIKVRIGDQITVLSPGASAFVPAGCVHGFRVEQAPAKLLEFDTNGGLEPYYRELAQTFRINHTIDPQILADIQRHHDTCPSSPDSE